MEENKNQEIKKDDKKESRKNNKTFCVIIIAFVFALSFCCGIVLGHIIFKNDNKNINSNDNIENKNDNNVKESEDTYIDIDLEKAKEIISNYSLSSIDCVNYLSNFFKNEVTVTDLDTEYVAAAVFNYAVKEEINNNKDFKNNISNYKLSIQKYREYASRLFGKDYEAKLVNSINISNKSIGCLSFVLNDAKNEYSAIDLGPCGDICGFYKVNNKLVYAKESKDKLVLGYKVIFLGETIKDENGEIITKVYSDYDNKNFVAGIYDINNLDYKLGSDYEITFVKENDEYVFLNSKYIEK